MRTNSSNPPRLDSPDVSTNQSAPAPLHGDGKEHPPGIFLDYRLTETIAPGADPDFRHVERWHVSIFPVETREPEERQAIGYAQLIILNLTPGVGVADLADRTTGEWVEFITKPTSGPDRTEPPRAASGGIGNNILILDRLWLEPAWRGRGLGPIAAAAAILRLSRGCRLVACYPAPFDRIEDPERRIRSIEALGAIWADVGFKLWDDGVWMLDLAETDMHAVMKGLLKPHPDRVMTVS
jgi:GNAT superfamily N-acetyltransferase